MEDILDSNEIDEVDVNEAAVRLVEARSELKAMEMFDSNDEDFVDFQTTN